ncbi:MAG: translocation/assembly module TamB [Proteobacteria bacterium]|nr:translocation/assembly module TamB [Pseudomonadota bacterium]MBU1736948.1 translocation/assembly module TamB [Pseudomonadota bacterium]
MRRFHVARRVGLKYLNYMTKFFRWAGSLLIFFSLLLSLLYLIREPLVYAVMKNVARLAAGRGGVALDIGSISGNLFSETRMENISVKPQKGQPQTYHFTARAIQCRYDLWDLREGFEPFIRGLDCSVEDPEGMYDFRGASTPEQTSDQSLQITVPEVLPGLELRNGSVLLTDTGWAVELKAMNAAFRPGDKTHELLIEVGELSVVQDEETKIETGFTARLRSAEEKLIIDSLDLAEQKVGASGWVALGRNGQGFAADLLFAESKLSARGTIENGFLKTQITTESFDLGELQKRLGGTGWDISGKIRGEAELDYSFRSQADRAGTFDLAFQHGRYNGVDIKTITAAGNFAAGALRISKAEAETRANRVSIENVFVPLSGVSSKTVLAIVAESRGEFAGEIADPEGLLKLFGLGEEAVPKMFRPDVLSFHGKLENGTLHLEEARVLSPDHRLTCNNVFIPLSGVSSKTVLATVAESRGEFAGEIADIEELLKLFGIWDEAAPETFSKDVLSLRGKLENRALYFEDVTVVASDLSVTDLRGEIGIPKSMDDLESHRVDLSGKFASGDLGLLVRRFGEIPVSGQVAGDVEIKGTLGAVHGVVKLAGENLEFGERALGSLALQGEIFLFQKKFGSLKEVRVALTDFSQENNSGRISLQPPFSGNWHPEGFSGQGAFLVDGQGDLSLGMTKDPGGEMAAELSVRNLNSVGWLENFLDRRIFFHGADLNVRFTGSRQNPQVHLDGTVDKAGTTGVPFPLSGKFELRYSSRGLEISEFTWESHERNRLTLTGHLPYDPLGEKPFPDGEVTLLGHVDFPALEDISVFLEPLGIGKGSLALDLDLSGSWDKPVGRVLLKAEGVEPPIALKELVDSPMNLVCELTAQDDAIVLKSASLESDDYTVRGTGSWQHGIILKEFLQQGWTGLKGEVAAEASVKLKDLNILRKKMPWLRRLEGDLQGEIHVAGPVAGPAMKGSFSLQNGEASHQFNFPMLSAINLQGDFDEQSINIHRMQAEVGGSLVSLAGNLERGEETVTVRLHGGGKNILLFRNNDMGMRGDVDLDVSGPLEKLVIKGTTGLTGGYYTRNIDFLGKIGSAAVPVSEGGGFLFSFPDPPLKDAVFDIKITTIEPFKIRNNVIRGVLRPELSLKGTGELPFLVGKVYIDPSRIILPSGRLQIKSGLVRFPEEDPDRPQLDILGQSKLLGYDINVVTRGAIDDPVITLSSSPALPNDDLLILLLTGQPPRQEGAGVVGSKGTRNVMVYLGRDFLNKWLEGENGNGDESILDRFELDFGRDVTKSGEQTVESTFRLTKQEAGTGKIYYLSGEKDKYDAYNYGFKMVFRFE